MNSYFRNAALMLSRGGQVHLTNKTTFPCDQWGLEDIAYENGLKLLDVVDFHTTDYPGYRLTGPEY